MTALRYLAHKALDTTVTTMTAFMLTLALAMLGVSAVKGPKAGLEVPANVIDGFGHLVQAADKYLAAR